MDPFFGGLPAKITTLTTRLSSIWAAKLDSLESRLTSARAGYIDKLNIAGTVVSTTDIADMAHESTPLLEVPIASGLVGLDYSLVGSMAAAVPGSAASTQSTSWTDAVNVTGQGVVELVGHSVPNAGTTYTAYLEILIDGVVVASLSKSSDTTSYYICAPIGSVAPAGTWGTFLACGAVPFKTSLQIRIKVSAAVSGGASRATFKYRRTA